MIAPARLVQVLGLQSVLLIAAGCPSSQVYQAPPPPNMIGADAGHPAGHSTVRIPPPASSRAADASPQPGHPVAGEEALDEAPYPKSLPSPELPMSDKAPQESVKATPKETPGTSAEDAINKLKAAGGRILAGER